MDGQATWARWVSWFVAVIENSSPVSQTTKLNVWPQLFKRWIALSSGWISFQWIAQLVFLILIHWRVIYPVDSAIQLLNNWDLDTKASCEPALESCSWPTRVYQVLSTLHHIAKWLESKGDWLLLILETLPGKQTNQNEISLKLSFVFWSRHIYLWFIVWSPFCAILSWRVSWKQRPLDP